MKNIFFALIYLWSILAIAADPPVSIKGQSGTKQIPKWNLQVPFQQATNLGGIDSLIETGNYNLLSNPGFEASTYSSGWTASGGSSSQGSGTDVAFGSKSYKWTPVSGGQTLTSTAITVPEGMKGTNGYVSCRVKTPNGNPGWSGFQIGVYNGTSVLAGSYIIPSTIVSFDTFTVVGTNFIFPTSGTVALQWLSGAGQLGDIDDCYLGPAINIGNIANAVGAVQLNDQAGYGSTATKIPYYTNTTINDPSGIFTVSNDSTNGVQITFLQPAEVKASIGFYTATVGTQTGVSVNGSVTANIYSNTDTQRKCLSQAVVIGGIGYAFTCASSFKVAVGDVVRPHTDGTACGDTNSCNFALTAISTASQQVLKQDCAQTGTCVNSFSAEFTSGCAVSKENVDWINGNGSSGGAGICTFTFNTNFFSQAPNCSVIAQTNLTAWLNGPANTSTVETRTYSGGTNTSSAGMLFCQRQGTDIKPSVNAPIFVGSVTSNSSGAERQERLIFGGSGSTGCTADPCTIKSQSGSWVSVVNRTAAGAYTVTVPSGMFSAMPTCICQGDNITTSPASCMVNPFTSTATSLLVTNKTDAGGSIDDAIQMICMGPR